MVEDKTDFSLPLLCNDVIFKSVFIGNEDILEKFIYDISGKKINNIKLEITEIPIIRKNEKFKVCDFVIRNGNEIINIELNSSYSKTTLIKNTSYAFGLFSRDASKGEKYNDKLSIIQINVNNYGSCTKLVGCNLKI